MRFSLALLLGLAGQFSSSPSIPTLPEHPRTLEISSVVKMEVPAFSYSGLPKQNEDGHLFFEADSGGMMKTVVEIDPSTSDAKRYRLPADVADQYNFVKFSVTVTGEVWFLTCRKDGVVVHAMEIDSNGKLATDVKLDWPDGVEPTDFQVIRDGHFLIAGYFADQAAPEKRGQPFTGVFDKNGNLTGGLKFKKGDTLPKIDLASAPARPHNGAVLQGSDGTIYFLNGSRIYLVNSSGEVTRTITFEIPADDLTPRNLSLSGNLIAVWLSRLAKDHRLSYNFLVIDLATGEVTGWYKPDPRGTDIAVGFSREEGFMFLRSVSGDLQLLIEQRK